MINYKQKGSDQDFSGICTEFASLLELDSESNAIGGAVNCSSSDPCQMYHSFDSDFIIPDFFVEYSLDNANDEVLKKLSVLSEETLSVEKTIVNNIVVYHLAQPNFPLLMMESIPSSATPKNEAEVIIRERKELLSANVINSVH